MSCIAFMHALILHGVQEEFSGPSISPQEAIRRSGSHFQWLPEERQVAIVKVIDPEHRPIFWWLKYHYRRPGEAQALHKEDFDGEAFTIHRIFSDKKLVNRTKTGEVHHIPCHGAFRPFIDEMRKREMKMGIYRDEVKVIMGDKTGSKNSSPFSMISISYGGSAWESNPPKEVLAPCTGFEVREPHQ